MNRDLLAAKSKQMATRINDIYGTRAIFRGAEIRLAIAAQESSIDLATGGFRETASFKIRFPAFTQPPPAAKEVVLEIGTGRKFFLTGLLTAAADSAIAQEHIAKAELA